MRRQLREWFWGCQPKAAPSIITINVNALLGPNGAYIIIVERVGETYYFRNLPFGCWRLKSGSRVFPVAADGDTITASNWMPLRDPEMVKDVRKLLGLEIECIGG